MTTITVGQARPGDVVLDSSSPRQCWQRGDEFWSWSTFAGPVMYMGPWEASYGPQGELTLLVRDGQPVLLPMNMITAGLTLTAVAAIAFGLVGYLSARSAAESPRAAADRGIAEFEELLDLESRTW